MAITGRGGAPFVSNIFRAKRRRMRTLPLVQQIQWADRDDAAAAILSDWMWPIVAESSTGQFKVYAGSSWVAKPVKVWTGSAWVTKPAKVWNGSAWVTTDY